MDSSKWTELLNEIPNLNNSRLELRIVNHANLNQNEIGDISHVVLIRKKKPYDGQQSNKFISIYKPIKFI